MRKLTVDELNRPSESEFESMVKMPVVILSDSIRSLNNVGSLFRTSDAFAVERVVLCGITATPPNKEMHKTALGAENSVEWSFFANSIDAVKQLKEQGYIIVAIEQVEGSVMLNDFKVDTQSKYALVLGNEVNGVDQQVVDMCDVAIEIPQIGTKHSLNVSVAAGVVIWKFFEAFFK